MQKPQPPKVGRAEPIGAPAPITPPPRAILENNPFGPYSLPKQGRGSWILSEQYQLCQCDAPPSPPLPALHGPPLPRQIRPEDGQGESSVDLLRSLKNPDNWSDLAGDEGGGWEKAWAGGPWRAGKKGDGAEPAVWEQQKVHWLLGSLKNLTTPLPALHGPLQQTIAAQGNTGNQLAEAARAIADASTRIQATSAGTSGRVEPLSTLVPESSKGQMCLPQER